MSTTYHQPALYLILAFTFVTSIMCPQHVFAQTGGWGKSETFEPRQGASYIIKTGVPLPELKKYAEIIGIRNGSQYILRPYPSFKSSVQGYEWQENHMQEYTSEIFEFVSHPATALRKAIVTFSPLITRARIQAILEEMSIPFPPGFDQKFKGINTVEVLVNQEEIIRLSEHVYVTSIDPVFEDSPLNFDAVSMTNSRLVKAPAVLSGEGLRGKGVVIGIGDDGANEHIDLAYNTLRQFNPIRSGGHAIHVSTTAAGSGIINESAEGFAPEAKNLSHIYNAVLVFSQTMYEDYNMTVTNNSYASRQGLCEFAGVYNSTSQYVDEMMISNPFMLHVFAAGNDGNKTCAPYPAGYGTVVGFYQASKNALVVGNIGKNIRLFSPTSSRGPVRDGRLKPEITAIGSMVFSGHIDNSYAPNNGTSMASPNVAGAAALLTEQYKKQYTGSQPPSSLLKALLINGAMDIHVPGPDFYYGFGLMDVHQSVKMLKNEQFLSDNITHGTSKDFSINVPANVRKVKFLVYWHDVPAVPSPDDHSISKLVNDIDSRITSPSGALFSPWILNPDIPTALAVRGTDRLNNVEQITIDDPAPGLYTYRITGHNITTDDQNFVITWDFEMDELELLNPAPLDRLAQHDTLRIYFKSPPTTHSFSIDLSADNGVSWSSVVSDLAADQRHYNMEVPPGITSEKCRIRVRENGTSRVSTSGAFVISQKTFIDFKVDHQQCPGSISVYWEPVTSATGYILFMLKEGKMVPVDTVAATISEYTFSGLNTSEEYWVSVAPVIHTERGIRANAINRIPDMGTCSGSGNPEYDVAVIDFNGMTNGRTATSKGFSDNEIISVTVQNRGRQTISQVPLSLSVDGISYEKDFPVTLAPGSRIVLHFTEYPVDMSVVRDYDITVFKRHTTAYTDVHTENDTAAVILRHIPNPPIDINEGYVENFHLTEPVFYFKNHIGLQEAEKWDFQNSTSWGRLYHFTNSDIPISDNRALTMDIIRNARTRPDSVSTNQAIVTLNLSDVDIEEKEVRFDFMYRFAGRSKFHLDNAVYVRGDDTAPWVFVTNLDSTYTGSIKYSGDISLNDFLSAAGQSFSSSTQVRFQQKDTSLVAGVDYGNGLTIDSFRLYGITNDVAIAGIAHPAAATCGTGSDHVAFEVKNNVFYTLYNVPVFYQIDGGSIRSGVVDSIPPKSTFVYSFSETEYFPNFRGYSIKAWVAYPDDDIRTNDTLEIEIYRTPLISSFPYLESFEEISDLPYFTAEASAWQIRPPVNAYIDIAANGSNALTTDNIKSDGADRVSYIYSPCFDISALSDPVLSFSNALYIQAEEDGNLPSRAYIEYSADGKIWQRLGTQGDGFNWYDSADSAWHTSPFQWRTSSIQLPPGSSLVLRFVFESFPGNNREYWAIDDIHIYDRYVHIPSEISTYASEDTHTTGTDTLKSGDAYIGTMASASPLGEVGLELNNHGMPIITGANEMTVPSSYTLRYSNAGQPYTLGLFVPHASVDRLSDTAVCATCSRVPSIYHTGISLYSTDEATEINFDLGDNHKGSYTFIPKESIIKIPYYDGYLLLFESSRQGEIWFNSGGENGHDISYIPVRLQGEQLNHIYAKVHFTSKVDALTSAYHLERKEISGSYTGIATFMPQMSDESYYEQTDQPVLVDNKAIYRLRYTDHEGDTHFTSDFIIDWNKMGHFGLFPNPVQDGDLNISWNLDDVQPIAYRIIHTQGRIITQGTIETGAHIGFTTLNIKNMNLPPGMYIIHLRSGSTDGTLRFIYLQ